MMLGLVFAVFIAFCVLMAWAGTRGIGWLGGLLSTPFVGTALYIEITTQGSMLADPYGDLLLTIIFVPLAVGWLFFGVASIFSTKYKSQLS